MEINGNTSDGYHTFNELYKHRMSLTCELTRHIGGIRSKMHYDGTMFDNYFIVMFYIDNKQCSYHYHIDNWDYFNHLKEIERAYEWDGHTANDVTDTYLRRNKDV